MQLAYSLTQGNRAAVVGTTEQGLEGDGVPERRLSRRRENRGPMGRWQVSDEVNTPLIRGFSPLMALCREDGTVVLKGNVNSQGV